MPFLKALIPCATSPIRSEILPRPNNSRTTAITTIQCQILSEPILQPSKTRGRRPGLIPLRKLGSGGVKNKDLGHVKSLLTRRIAASVNLRQRAVAIGADQLPPSFSGSTAG